MKTLLLVTLLSFGAVSISTDALFAQQMTKQEIKAQMKAEKEQKKKDRNKSSSSPVVVVTPTPTPVPTPAPAPVPTPVVKPAPQPYINWTPGMIAAQQLHPLASCTYCAAYAASQGDLATVEAIGSPYTPPAAPAPAPAPAEAPAANEPAPAPAEAPASEPAQESAPAVSQ